MRILGISAFYHDSAAAVLVDGELIAAAQEERFTRKKHDASYPTNAIQYCLGEAGCDLDQIDRIVFYDKPFLKFERLLETYISFAPKGFNSFRMALPVWLKEKLFQKDMLKNELKKSEPDCDWDSKLLFCEHHMSHAASAFFPSPFEEAVVLTMDGVGEWTTTSVAYGKGSSLEILKELHFPHSLGLLYSAFTYYTGFRVNSGEYKLMGLAPYGSPKYKSLILDNLVDVKDDGTFRLDQKYFDYCTGLTMTNRAFDELFGRPARVPEKEPLDDFHMDIAASIQAVTEEIMIRLTRSLAKEYDCPNLCLAGGVALNCVANGEILRDQAFKNIWIQPAAGDAGGALGAALAANHLLLKQPRKVVPTDAMKGSYLGPDFDQTEIESRLTAVGAKFEVLEDEDLLDTVVDGLTSDKAIGWFQGRMEFGPRALGARSIIGDPRSPTMQKSLNLKVKFRESFRPFAPSILQEDANQWFQLDAASPYMLIVAGVNDEHRLPISEEDKTLFGIDRLNIARSNIPSVTHVDYSARVQTVHRDTNPRYHALISRFKERTGCPIVVNTSFNIRGEPIVGSPEDAFKCLMGTDLEMLAIGNCVLKKEDQDPILAKDYRDSFDLD